MRNVKESVKEAAIIVIGVPVAYVGALLAGAALAVISVFASAVERLSPR